MGADLDDVEVGSRVRAARESRGLSLRDLAGSLGLSPATMSHLETGKASMSVTRLQRIARKLGRSVDDILEPQSEPLPEPAAPRLLAGEWREYRPLELDPVLVAAMAVFLRQGYHGASVRDVAAESGLSVAGIYHHHASKQEMLARILDLGMDDLLARCRAAVSHGHDALERFRLLVETMALFHTHRRDIGFLAASEMRSLEPAARADMTARRSAQQRLVDTEVEAGVVDGRFWTPYPHEASRAVVTMCKSIAQWYSPTGRLAPVDVAERYVQFALGVVQYREGPPPGAVR